MQVANVHHVPVRHRTAETDYVTSILQDAISRVQALEEEGRITGIMDDRGKFIYISHKEMLAMADFVKSRGRVAIGELAAATLIDLEQKCASDLNTLFLGFLLLSCWHGWHASISGAAYRKYLELARYRRKAYDVYYSFERRYHFK